MYFPRSGKGQFYFTIQVLLLQQMIISLSRFMFPEYLHNKVLVFVYVRYAFILHCYIFQVFK